MLTNPKVKAYKHKGSGAFLIGIGYHGISFFGWLITFNFGEDDPAKISRNITEFTENQGKTCYKKWHGFLENPGVL